MLKNSKVHFYLLLSVIVLAVGFLLGELFVRIFYPQKLTPLIDPFAVEPRIIVPDEEYGWVHVRGYVGTYVRNTHVSINSLRLRDREYAEKKPDEVRILSLGDSYAFGYGVENEDSYAKVLEGLLRKRFPESKISVINGGVPGYNTQQMNMEFIRLKDVLEPDFILATFVAGNDVSENAIFEDRLAQRVSFPVGFFGRTSQLVRLCLRVAFPVIFFINNRSTNNISYTIQLLQQFESDLDEAGLPYFFLMIPARHQVRPEVHRGAQFIMAIGASNYMYHHSVLVREHFEQDRIPFVDPQQILEERDRQEPVYFEYDSHTNALGHQILAELVFEKIQSTITELIAEVQ